MDETQVLKNKQMRGQIIRTLALFYPDATSVSNVRSALITKGVTSTGEMDKHLVYLEDKKYITVNAGLIKDAKDDDMINLTAKGVDLVEETIKDPGVIL
jgi:hypothetical protein